MTENEVRKLIEDGLPGAVATVRDTTGTGDHFAALVEAPQFAGKTMVQQHQLVYKALGEHIQGSHAPIHALSLTTQPLNKTGGE
jgi:stress-induced morphogen